MLKKIQLIIKSFTIENPFSKFCYTFYCGKGVSKHLIYLSLETSYLLNTLLESRHLDIQVLNQNEVEQLKNLIEKERNFPLRYQIYNSEECPSKYLIIFDIYEQREYFGCTVYEVLQIE